MFLVHKGNVIDTFSGIPSDELLKDFVNTGLLLEGMQNNKEIVE